MFLEGTNSLICCKYKTYMFLSAENELVFGANELNKSSQNTSKRVFRTETNWDFAGRKTAAAGRRRGLHEL